MPGFNFYYKKCFHVEKWGWRKPNLKMAIDNIAQQLSEFPLLSKIFPIFTRNEEVASDWDRVCTSRQSESLPDSPPPPHTRPHPWLRLSDTPHTPHSSTWQQEVLLSQLSVIMELRYGMRGTSWAGCPFLLSGRALASGHISPHL